MARTKRFRVKKGRLVEDTAYNVSCDECGDLTDEDAREHVRNTGHSVTVAIDCFRVYEAVK